MQKGTIELRGHTCWFYSVQTLVVGSGAAGLNAAVSMVKEGQTDVAILTEGRTMGTSRNTGSDKQTYYKLTTSGSEPDSVRKMAETLFAGQSMDGDLALVEAALSLRGFCHLVDIGVPFPCNGSGEYIGYKTDHDPNQRGTSAGPLTSRFMTEALWKEVERYRIPVLDGYQVIELLTEGQGEDRRVRGLMALDRKEQEPENQYVVVSADNIVYATGGEAGMYETSVYPVSQTGGMGTAFRAGARGKNLTESQYGIASTKFRWNLSGTYQQVIPRYVSTDPEGGDEQEFLDSWFENPENMLYAIFLKGYQWPFDPRKTMDYGSSLIDLLVYQETVLRGRRVFLDYRRNPSAAGKDGHFAAERLHPEAYAYLKSSDGLWDTPIQRLEHMNPAAIDLYRSHNIDLYEEMLEIAVCAQHNNGGLAGNCWWESNLRHLFPVGEVNGSHGVYRPGGSALNSGQAGSLRAAQYIAHCYKEEPWDQEQMKQMCGSQMEAAMDFGLAALGEDETGITLAAEAEQVCQAAGAGKAGQASQTPGTGKAEQTSRAPGTGNAGQTSQAPGTGRHLLDLKAERRKLGIRMSESGANIRSAEGVRAALEANRIQQKQVASARIGTPSDLKALYRLRDLLVSQQMYLEAIADYIRQGGTSRGSYLIYDPDGVRPLEKLPEGFRFSLEDKGLGSRIQEIVYEDGACRCMWRPVRPMPQEDNWFEAVWRNWREGAYYGTDI